MRTTPATTLEEIHQTLSPKPLATVEEIKAFYKAELNHIRGDDKIKRLQLGLNRAFKSGSFYKACLMGHQGVGKSTELTRLVDQIKDQFCIVRFSALNDLNPGQFNPLDVLLIMMAEVAENTAAPVDAGGAGQQPPQERLREIWDWFASEQITRTQVTEAAIETQAGVGVQQDSLWEKVLGLFASLKGEIKFASARKREVLEHRLIRLSTLIEVANRLLIDCNQILREKRGCEWLFIGEDFDKAGIPSQSIEDLFITYANIFSELNTHLIFNLPIGLYYSSEAVRLPFPNDRSLIIPDTPMFNRDHSSNQAGQDAVKAVLEARVTSDLFEVNQMKRLIVASGGNLRDLFSLVNFAADTAILRNTENCKINAQDVDSAIKNLRTDYERRLGQNPFDKAEISYEDKAKLIKEIYDGHKEAQITDPVLYSLLRARAIQEFNGERWFGVHPLVVDILSDQGKIPCLGEGVPGGSV